MVFVVSPGLAFFFFTEGILFGCRFAVWFFAVRCVLIGGGVLLLCFFCFLGFHVFFFVKLFFFEFSKLW